MRLSARLFCILGLVVTWTTTSHASQGVNIQTVTSTFAPLQMMQNGRPTGYVVDLVKKVIERVNQSQPTVITATKIQPWQRSFHVAKSSPNVLFFSVSRTPTREDLFHWVGEVTPYEVYFHKLKRRADLKAESLEELKAAKLRIGVPKKSNTETLLLENGFKKGENFVTYSHYTKGIRMLFAGRFDVMPLTIFVARSNVCKLGLPGDDIEPLMRIDAISKPLWLVFSKGTPEALVDRFRHALSALKSDGTAERLRRDHLTAWQTRPCDQARH